MALCCGCEIKPGMPVSTEMVKAHYKHTFEVLLLWELMHRPGRGLSDDNLKLSQARIDLIDVIAKLYPEVAREDD